MAVRRRRHWGNAHAFDRAGPQRYPPDRLDDLAPFYLPVVALLPETPRPGAASGEARGIATPVNRAMWALVKLLEQAPPPRRET